MGIGSRSCQVQLWRKDATAGPLDEYRDRQQGNPLVLVATMWASMVPLSGAEIYKDREREALTRYMIETGWFEGRQADASMIFTYQERQFDIVAILPDENTRRAVRFMVDEKPTGA